MKSPPDVDYFPTSGGLFSLAVFARTVQPQEIQEKRIALVHRQDDYVEKQNMGGMAMG